MVKWTTMDGSQQTRYLFLFAGGMLSNSEILHLTMVLLPSIVYIVLSTLMLFLITITVRPQCLVFSFKHLYRNNQWCTQHKFSKHNWCLRTENPGNETCPQLPTTTFMATQTIAQRGKAAIFNYLAQWLHLREAPISFLHLMQP